MSSRSESNTFQKNQTINLNPSRIFYLDYLRAFIVFLVVALHSAMAYAIYTPSWTWVIDIDRNITFDIILLLTDNFMMPILFFIAGFFSLLSIHNKNISNFLKRRFMRLGIPYIGGILIVIPIAMYIQNISKNVKVSNYIDYWFFTYIPKEINPAHLWFLLILLFLTIIFSIIYKFRRTTFNIEDNANPKKFQRKYLLIFPLYTGLIFFIVNLFVSDFYWIGFYQMGLPYFNILQVTRGVFYIGYFFLGVFAFKNGWFSQKNNSYSLTFWSISALILSIVLVTFYNFFYLKIETNLILIFTRAMLWSFFCFSMLMMLLIFFKKRFNKPSKIGKKLSSNSYAIYIIHLPLVVGLQYLLMDVSLLIFAKFFIVFFGSLFISYLISEYILHRIPGIRTIL